MRLFWQCSRLETAVSEPIDIIIPLLQRMQLLVTGIDRKLDTLVDDVQLPKVRVTGMEESLIGVHRRMDNFEIRLDRIERRLDLTEA